jgi:hypothetical protein
MPSPRALEGRRAEVAALAIIALAVVALTIEGFAGRLPSVRDMACATIPSRWFWRESILGGHLPLWNPYVSLGSPTIASPVHGSLYPGHIALALLPFRAGFFATWALHAVVAGAGGYALARSCGCRAESALVSGLVWAVGGYATSMWWNGEKLLPTAWIPWTAWGVREVARAPRIFGKELALSAPFGAMLCAAGDPFLLFDAALLGVFAACVEAPGRPGARPVRVLAASSAVFGVTLMLAAPALLPAALLSSETGRGTALALEGAQLWSMHPVRWLELFVPSPLGDPLGEASSYAGAPYADAAVQVHPWAVSLFTGSATVALAIAARGRRVLGPLGGAALIAVLLALGRYAPFDRWARIVVPGLALSRFPEKHVVVACGAIALLAARGVEGIFAGAVKARLVVVVALAGLGLALLLAPAPLRATTQRGAVHAAIAVAALGGALFAARRGGHAAWLVPLVVAADLVTSSRALLEWMPADALAPPPIARDLATPIGSPPRRILRLPSADFRRVATLPEDAASLFRVGAVPGWDPAVSPLVDPIAKALVAEGPRLVELLRIDAVMVPSDPDVMAPEWKILRAPSRPRAWMVGGVLLAQNDAEALASLAGPQLDPEAVAIVMASEALREVAPLEGRAPRAMGECETLDYEATRVSLRCRAAAPALLVVADTAMRGWRAEVDGRRASILRANVAMRGVVLDEGTHEVEMRFEPPGLVEGFLVFLLGLLVSALALVRARARRG